LSLVCGGFIAYEDELRLMPNSCFILLSIDFASFEEKKEMFSSLSQSAVSFLVLGLFVFTDI